MKCSVTLYSSLFLVILHLLTYSNNYLGTFLRNSRGGSLKMCILSHFNEYGVLPFITGKLLYANKLRMWHFFKFLIKKYLYIDGSHSHIIQMVDKAGFRFILILPSSISPCMQYFPWICVLKYLFRLSVL